MSGHVFGLSVVGRILDHLPLIFEYIAKGDIVGTVLIVTPSFLPAGIRGGRLLCASARLKQAIA
ncbi:MAG: hypothetical protein AAGH90_11990, partial [Pseudomonadota bacterium]